MFNCATCKNPVGPGVSPRKVITSAPCQHTMQVGGEIRVFAGSKIVREDHLCNSCAGFPEVVKRPLPTDDKAVKLAAITSAFVHARRCKEAHTSDCYVCKKNMEFMATIPASELGELLNHAIPKQKH
jgi:hypothetical protein